MKYVVIHEICCYSMYYSMYLYNQCIISCYLYNQCIIPCIYIINVLFHVIYISLSTRMGLQFLYYMVSFFFILFLLYP